ncbi:MAG: hypothetical protein HXY45_10815 [Syntrophaceae bacterium]|nr:hypothetical protein [Syntrophaceae bacterium]
MRFRYGLLSLPLLFIVLILGYENYLTWSSPGTSVPKKEGDKRVEGKTEPLQGIPAPKEPPSRETFAVIVEKNIFSPERKEFVAQAAPVPGPEKPAARPPITLYGVVIAGDYQTASIVNPGRPLQKGEREIKTIKVGETIGEYKITKIMPDRIVLEGGEDSFEVLLLDPRAPKKRVEIKTANPPAAITSPESAAPPSEAKPVAPPAAVSPPAAPSAAPATTAVPRPTAPPVPVPRTSAPQPEMGYQTPAAPTPPPAPSPVPDPGVWRGRRPVSPGGPSG